MNIVQYSTSLPRGESSYLDANFLIALADPLHRKYQNAQTLMKMLLGLDYTLFLSHLSLAEFWFNALKLLLKQAGERRWIKDVVRDQPQLIRPFQTRLHAALYSLLQITSLRIIGYPNDLALPMDALGYIFGIQVLLPFDALHLAYSLKAGARYLVSEDRDFSGVTIPGSSLEILRY